MPKTPAALDELTGIAHEFIRAEVGDTLPGMLEQAERFAGVLLPQLDRLLTLRLAEHDRRMPRQSQSQVREQVVETLERTMPEASAADVARIADALLPTVAQAQAAALLEAADEIERELICCPDHEPNPRHKICYWSIMCRRLVLDRAKVVLEQAGAPASEEGR